MKDVSVFARYHGDILPGGCESVYTGSNGWAKLWVNGSAIVEISVQGHWQGDYTVVEGDTLSFTANCD